MSEIESLAGAIDELGEAWFFGHDLPPGRAEELAEFVASRQGKPGSYRGMFAPMPVDWKGIRFFTGERIATRAGLSHILGEESMRALTLADPLKWAGPLKRGRDAAVFIDAGSEPRGFFCCGPCTAALLRACAANAYGDRKARSAACIQAIKEHRDGERWGRFPFYYTLLALWEAGAKEELEYARPACERALRTARSNDKYGERRRALLERVLS